MSNRPTIRKGPALNSHDSHRTALRNWHTKDLFWSLLPPFATLFYPRAVAALYESARLADSANGLRGAIGRLAIIGSVALIYGVPAAGLAVAYRLGLRENPSSAELRARRIAHLTVASPSLFVLLGVVLYLLHLGNAETALWSMAWLSLVAVIAWSFRSPVSGASAAPGPAPLPLRIAHGTSALAIVLIFLGLHVLNHASAAFSLEFNQEMMRTLRGWYRAEVIQPALVALMLFQVGSGVVLLWRATAMPSDFVRTLQTATGAFMTAFIVSHINAVFVLGRSVTKADTNFLWASGAPAGLLHDAWNVRLIPHYSLGVWFVILHMGIGLRGVLLAHGKSTIASNRVAWAIGILGAAVAITITCAQLSVQAGQGFQGYGVP